LKNSGKAGKVKPRKKKKIPTHEKKDHRTQEKHAVKGAKDQQKKKKKKKKKKALKNFKKSSRKRLRESVPIQKE